MPSPTIVTDAQQGRVPAAGARSAEPTLSVIIPALNEAESIAATLGDLQPLRARDIEIVVVDGGSTDDTVALASEQADHVINSAPGRARQMNRGASVARGQYLWFLHADTRIPADVPSALLQACEQGVAWGRFCVRLSGRHPMFRLIARSMNLRSRLTQVVTGDQGMLIRRSIFKSCGGFPDIPLMEDVALSKKLRRDHDLHCFPQTLVTSSRRWEGHGVWRTILLMWRLRLAYFCGADPQSLASRYRASAK